MLGVGGRVTIKSYSKDIMQSLQSSHINQVILSTHKPATKTQVFDKDKHLVSSSRQVMRQSDNHYIENIIVNYKKGKLES